MITSEDNPSKGLQSYTLFIHWLTLQHMQETGYFDECRFGTNIHVY